MKCIVCHGEEIVKRDVKEEVVRGDDIVLVPIQTFVCQHCGERYYDRKTMPRGVVQCGSWVRSCCMADSGTERQARRDEPTEDGPSGSLVEALSLIDPA